METTSRLPANFKVFKGAKNNPESVGNGAITSPMAVSFREEKLALRTNDLNASASPDAKLSPVAGGGRG